MNFKRKIATGLAITLLVSSLVGCSSSNKSGDSADASGSATTIDFWAPLGGTNGETAQKMVD